MANFAVRDTQPQKSCNQQPSPLYSREKGNMDHAKPRPCTGRHVADPPGVCFVTGALCRRPDATQASIPSRSRKPCALQHPAVISVRTCSLKSHCLAEAELLPGFPRNLLTGKGRHSSNSIFFAAPALHKPSKPPPQRELQQGSLPPPLCPRKRRFLPCRPTKLHPLPQLSKADIS